MKKSYLLIIITVAVLGIVGACKEDFLNITPNGSLDASVMGSETGIDGLLIGCYAVLDGTANYNTWESAGSNWVFGEIRGLIANKGTDAADQPAINPLQSYTEESTNSYINTKWVTLYEAITRCNNVILVADKSLADGKITQAKRDLFVAQARALRGFYHFEAWRMWEMIPYIDETMDPLEVGNSIDVRSNIISDLQAGVSGLPTDMDQIGRWNKTVCQVMLAKALMTMNGDYAAALPLLQDVKTNGTNPAGGAIGLHPHYGEIFMIENRNCSEAVYTVQYSVNDGARSANAGYPEILNFPYSNGPGKCCGFYQGTQEWVNSFRTSGGLPLLDFTYNNAANAVKSDQGLAATEPFTEDAGPLDPRLDWSVGRRGIPYFDWGEHGGNSWIRQQSYAGPYSGKKQVYKRSQERVLTDITNWTNGVTANGYRMIRFADVLLLLAECQIETNDLAGARTNINLVRARAANSVGWVYEADGVTPAANYVINEYPLTGYPFDSQANARLAVRMERKLELGMEGHRWWDLKRWGIAQSEGNRVLDYETTTPWGASGDMYLQGTARIGAEDLWYPLPQRQIDLMGGLVVQNR